MNDNPNDTPDYVGALTTELGIEPPAADDTSTPPAPTPAGDDGGDDAGQPPKADTENKPPVLPTDDEKKSKEGEPAGSQGGDDAGKDKPKEGDDTKVETQEEKANREAAEAAAAQPKFATPEDVKNAMREYNQETAQRVTQVNSARDEIIEKLYPAGIDRNIYDSNGQVVKTAQDIVDRGLLKENGEPYTYEEAASFILEANRQMTQNIEELNHWAEGIAEQNISLYEGNQRVIQQWGDILKAMPQLANDLAEEYITTQLEFDKTGSYITRMGMAPEAYYNRALAPYKQLGEALAAKQQLEAEQAAKAKTDEQSERNGLPPQRGTSDVKSNTGDEFVDALIDEMKKG